MWVVGRSNVLKVSKKCLATMLGLDQLGELKCSLRPPRRSGGQRREHSLPKLGALSGEEGGWKYVEGVEMNEKGYFRIRHRQRLGPGKRTLSSHSTERFTARKGVEWKWRRSTRRGNSKPVLF